MFVASHKHAFVADGDIGGGGVAAGSPLQMAATPSGHRWTDASKLCGALLRTS